MNKKIIIETQDAPQAIGVYSQSVRSGNLLFVSGQIPLDPATGEVVAGDFSARTQQVMRNVAAICAAAGAGVDDIVKLTVYLTDLSNFAAVNEVMAGVFSEPYPARAAVGVAALPKGVDVEVDAVVQLPSAN